MSIVLTEDVDDGRFCESICQLRGFKAMTSIKEAAGSYSESAGLPASVQADKPGRE